MNSKNKSSSKKNQMKQKFHNKCSSNNQNKKAFIIFQRNINPKQPHKNN